MRAERNFDGRRWVAYDWCYRREALAQKNLNWSVPNARLYNEAFTGYARSLPRCSFCLGEDHQAQVCPRNPHRPWFGWLQHPVASHPPPPPRRANRVRCRSAVAASMTGGASSQQHRAATSTAAWSAPAHTPVSTAPG